MVCAQPVMLILLEVRFKKAMWARSEQGYTDEFTF
jgi:hypothetical protein